MGQLIQQLRHIALADVLLHQRQGCHAAVLHDVVVGDHRDIDQRKRPAIELAGGLRIGKIIQPAHRPGIGAASSLIKENRDNQRQRFMAALQVPLHGGDGIEH